jgi:hypothetical protein
LKGFYKILHVVVGAAFLLVIFYFLLLIAVAFKIVVKVDAGYYFGLRVALRENNTQMLLLLRMTLERISRTWLILQIAFLIIDVAILHDVLHFGLRDMSALHATLCVLRVFKITDFSVESASAGSFAFGLRAIIICAFAAIIQATAGTNKQQQSGEYD